MLKNQSEIQNKAVLIQLGNLIKNYMLINYKDRTTAETEIKTFYEKILQENLDINLISAEGNAQLVLGKLSYQYLQKREELNLSFEFLCQYVLEADRNSLQTFLSPTNSLIDVYILLGERGLTAIQRAEAIAMPTKTFFEFWRTQETLNQEHAILKSNSIKHEIEPICKFINLAEANKLGLNRRDFNDYLRTHLNGLLNQEYKNQNDLIYIEFFENGNLSLAKKHSLRDNFINEKLAEEKQDSYFSARTLLAFYNNQIDYEKMYDLVSASLPKCSY